MLDTADLHKVAKTFTLCRCVEANEVSLYSKPNALSQRPT